MTGDPRSEADRERQRLLAAAARYGEHGWPTLPLHGVTGGACSCGDRSCGSPGKHPRTRHGLKDATTDPDRIRQWWSRWPTANVGVITGAGSGLVVVDVDLPDGPTSLEQLEADHGRLPNTCEQHTGSGGRQLLFAHPGTEIANRTGVRPGIDIRADGGYIVVPPSRHATGDRYRWTGRVPPAAAPGWLLELVAERDRDRPMGRRTAVPPIGIGGPPDRYAQAALDDELARLSQAVEGTRNDTLNRAAFNLGQLVAAGALDHDRVAAQLEHVALEVGLGLRETRRTIASGLTAGADAPRRIPTSDARPRAGSARAPVRQRIRRL